MEEVRSMKVTFFDDSAVTFEYDGFPTMDDYRTLVGLLQRDIELHERTNPIDEEDIEYIQNVRAGVRT